VMPPGMDAGMDCGMTGTVMGTVMFTLGTILFAAEGGAAMAGMGGAGERERGGEEWKGRPRIKGGQAERAEG